MSIQYPLDEPHEYECPHCGGWVQSRKGELEEFRNKVKRAIADRTGEPILC